MQNALAPLINEDVATSYMPSRNSDVIKELISKMERASLEIDTYAKAQQELVSREAVELINEVMIRAKSLQDSLSLDINRETQSLDLEFSKRREQLLRDLDLAKAERLSTLQSGLAKRQENIHLDARRQIDEITARAKQKKLEIVSEAQQKHNMLSQNLASTTVQSFSTDKLNTTNVDLSKESLRPTGSELRTQTGSLSAQDNLRTNESISRPNVTRDTVTIHGAGFDGRDRT